MELVNNSHLSTVLVGLSGGVDSSVAAAVLQEAGYRVIGVTMRIFDGFKDKPEDDVSIAAGNACYGPGEEEDIEKAQELADTLGIPYHVIDLRDEYKRTVLDYFRTEYRQGRTPNPCLRCNAEMKFGYMLEKSRQIGINFDYFATGHYARIWKGSQSGPLLQRAKQRSKDQSYFLYRLSKEQLSHTLFPVGELSKEEVRGIAVKFGLPSAYAEESQDFIDGGDYSVLFSEEDFTKGDIVDSTGRRLGTHQGLVKYTVGQRKGLGISYHEPLYVVEKRGEENTLVVGTKEELKTSICTIEHVMLHNNVETYNQLLAQIRQGHQGTPVEIRIPEKNSIQETGRAEIEFFEPQLAVTPGQSVVLYSQDTVIGGGIIT
ncbi:MAG: tRNA 2-thiouridine(34) synthase MnmA [Spirochaetota bacterium]